jgi:RNA polymerase sigma factor (sigma-70 family)
MPVQDPCQHYQANEVQFYDDLRAELPEAFTCLYLQTYQRCLPYALNKGSDQADAEDLLQECLGIFVEKIRDGSYAFQEGAKISTYFYRIYINQWKKSIEQRVRRGEVRLQAQVEPSDSDEDESYKATSPSSPFVAIVRGDDGEEESVTLPDMIGLQDYDEDERAWVFGKLRRAMELLAEDCRKVLTWFYVEDWSLRQIGEALGLTEASATVKRFKCAKYLKEKFRLV